MAVSDTLRTIRASLEDGCDYLQIEGYDEWHIESFITEEMATAASRLKTSVTMLTPAAMCWVDFLVVKSTWK